METLSSLNLMNWIDENRKLLKPPMLNKPIWQNTDFIIMILAGPILRTDFHVNPYEEFFYQLKGNMTLKIIENKTIKEIKVSEGSVFLLPAYIPHSPQRPEPESLGLVIERTRPEGVMDQFEWICENCVTCVHRAELHLSNFARDRNFLFKKYYSKIANKNCRGCGVGNPKDTAFTQKELA